MKDTGKDFNHRILITKYGIQNAKTSRLNGRTNKIVVFPQHKESDEYNSS